MLCCFDSFSDPHKAYNRQTSDDIVSSFPGRRSFQNTGGNALAAPPQSSQLSSYGGGGGGDMIGVTVPPGVQPGQTIQVNSPDGRTVHAQVPNGMTAGSQFMVRMPSRTVSPNPPPMAPPTPAQIVEPQDYSNLKPLSPPQQEPFVPALPAYATAGSTTIPVSRVTSASNHAVPSAPFMTYAVAAPIEAPVSPIPPPQVSPYSSTNNNQKLMKVSVPPGMQPGSTIHVQVPGESRTIAATIPPGVSEFHVSYESHNAAIPVPPQAPPGQKLLLVRVPPGMRPGTMLHVTIPEEPGRVVSATVPPNATEFHVAYMPSQKSSQQGYAVPMSNNNRGMANSDQNNRNNNNRNGNRGGGMSGMMLPMMGGAALGAAGMGMFGHYGNQQQQNEDTSGYDNDGGDDNLYDDGGGDYGGGFGDY